MDVNAILKNLSDYNTNIYQNKSTNEDMDKSSISNVEKSSAKNDDLSKDKNNEDNNKVDENKVDKKDIDKAVNTLNKFLEPERTHAEYSVHKQLGTIMVKVIDDNSKKVLLEVPSEKILNMVASMCEQAGLIDEKA